MNEVKVFSAIVPASQSTSSNGIDDTKKSETKLDNGKDLPIKEAENTAEKVDKNTAQANTAEVVEEVNQFVQSVQRDLHFSVDEDSGLTVIRVRDKESGELIRQIPEDIFLSLAQNLKENNTIQLLDTHG